MAPVRFSSEALYRIRENLKKLYLKIKKISQSR